MNKIILITLMSLGLIGCFRNTNIMDAEVIRITQKEDYCIYTVSDKGGVCFYLYSLCGSYKIGDNPFECK